jgi:hypothetical protein
VSGFDLSGMLGSTSGVVEQGGLSARKVGSIFPGLGWPPFPFGAKRQRWDANSYRVIYDSVGRYIFGCSIAPGGAFVGYLWVNRKAPVALYKSLVLYFLPLLSGQCLA